MTFDLLVDQCSILSPWPLTFSWISVQSSIHDLWPFLGSANNPQSMTFDVFLDLCPMLIPLPLTFPQMHDLYWDQWTLTFLRQGASMPMTVYHFSYFDLWYCLWPAACTQTIDLTFSHTCDIWPCLMLIANTPWPCLRLVVFMLTPVTFDLLSGLWPIFIDQISELCLYFTNINSCWPFSDLWHLTMPHILVAHA